MTRERVGCLRLNRHLTGISEGDHGRAKTLRLLSSTPLTVSHACDCLVSSVSARDQVFAAHDSHVVLAKLARDAVSLRVAFGFEYP